MAAALVTTFLKAKMGEVKTSLALYAVSSDVDGAKVVREMSRRMNRAIVAMLATSKDELTRDPELVASMLQSAMAGVSRRILEPPHLKLSTNLCATSSFFLCAPIFALVREQAPDAHELPHPRPL